MLRSLDLSSDRPVDRKPELRSPAVPQEDRASAERERSAERRDTASTCPLLLSDPSRDESHDARSTRTSSSHTPRARVTVPRRAALALEYRMQTLKAPTSH
ncbi:hypothetical protein RR48_05134 [Papilio machaon]|uniref:Uncharacterized protein n=1 Tax=Papilio machaon TaxID=76193 RepID=A0A0N1IP00_PAPMA|nr:hypothetical protein RR48_05134 [Papilio machaon]